MTFDFTDDQASELMWWRDHLRDTTKKQTVKMLRNTDGGFCCLGLYLDECSPENWVVMHEEACGGYWSFHYNAIDDLINFENRTHHKISLPLKYRRKLGLDQIAWFDEKNDIPIDLQTIFMKLNDGARWTFSQIADEIDYILEHGEISSEAFEAVKD